jgi:AraC-like DNA-binding protein
MPAPSHDVFPEPACPESGAWDEVRAGWRLLYGNFAELGVALEWHDFRAATALDWGRSFHPGGIELCVNQSGAGEVRAGRQRTVFRAQTAGIYAAADGPIAAERQAGEAHRFLTLEMRREFLAQQLAGSEDAVHPAVRASLLDDRGRSFAGEAREFPQAKSALVEQLAMPPVAPGAFPLWYQGKVCELLAEFTFTPQAELFCARQQRLARERVERVQTILRARFAEPPTLEQLGREVGVSQFYLSRIFSQETRMTIPQFIRRVRMERAAELLRAGRHNVTEAAFAVGYSSLGHFSKSFCEVMGCCPALYPQARHLAKR